MADFRFSYLLNAVVFAVLGLAVLAVGLSALDRCMPARLWKAVAEEKNVALAILVGSVVIGMSLIIAAAMH